MRLIFALPCLVALAVPPLARAEEAPLWTEGRRGGPTPAAGPQTFSRLSRALGPAVVNISTMLGDDGEARGARHQRSRGQGTGVLIHKDGFVLTNNHVVEHADEIKVRLADDRQFPAAVVGTDARTDLALLKISVPDEALPVAPLGDSDRIEIGEWVMAIGNPFGLDHTVTVGIVSGKGRRDVRPGGTTAGFYDFIQTDASINAGNSGGPLINSRGEVIGINTAMNAAAQGIAFAIPINMVKTIVPLLRRHGRAPRSWLGVSPQSVTAALRRAFKLPDMRGALVSEVAEGSPARAAGIESGDVITDFDGQAIRRADDLQWWAATAGAGRKVAIRLRRGGESRVVSVTLAPDPDEAAPVEQAAAGREHPTPLGMVVAEITAAAAAAAELREARGVVVVQIESGSPASEAGLERGDVLLRVGDDLIAKLEDYGRVVRSVAPGAVIRLLARRDGKNFWAAFEKR